MKPRQPSRPAPQWFLAVIFLATIAGVPLLQTILELRRGEEIGALEVFRQKPTSARLRAYEKNLEESSVVARALRPWVQYVQFAWLHDGGEKALVGRNGWLFYKPGVDDLVARGRAPREATNDPVAAMVAFRDALAARGIRLLVVPAPNKESIYPDLLTGRVAAGRTVMSANTRAVLARLRTADVEVVDLFARFGAGRVGTVAPGGAPLYLAQDSHWSPAGVALAAQAVAERLQALGWVGRGAVAYRERSVPVARHGDVLRMLRAAPLERCATPERVSARQVVRADTGQLYRDDPASGVLVLGDSFLRIYEQDDPGAAGFVAHLAKELQQPLTSLVSDGGASTLVRQELYRRPGLMQNKRVVIWEFVERDLRLGTEGWQHVPLPTPGSGHTDAEGGR